MIQGVIFDMDGLMFDTERIWATLWEPALAGLGFSIRRGWTKPPAAPQATPCGRCCAGSWAGLRPRPHHRGPA